MTKSLGWPICACSWPPVDETPRQREANDLTDPLRYPNQPAERTAKMTYVPLDISDLVVAASLMLINGLVSWAFALKLERTLFINSVRMALQLAMIGFVLKWIFAQTSPVWTAGLATIMILVAGYEIVSRLSRRPKGFSAYLLGSGTLFLVGTLGTGLRGTRHYRSRPLVSAPLCTADPRYGAGQRDDRHRTHHQYAFRIRKPRPNSHRSASVAWR